MEENLSCNVPVHRPYGQTPYYVDRPSAKSSSHQQAPPQHNYDQLRHFISISSFLRVKNCSEMGQAIIDTPTYQSTDCFETSKWFSDKNSFETGLWFRQQITECSWKIKSILSGEEVWLLFSNQGIFWCSGEANSQDAVSSGFHLLRKMALQTPCDILGTLSWVKFGVI